MRNPVKMNDPIWEHDSEYTVLPGIRFSLDINRGQVYISCHLK